jgi:hypothetical protein
MERRDFLLLLVTAAVARPWSAPPMVHLTFMGDGGDALRGAEMSADEVRRAAEMFGRQVDFSAERPLDRPGRLRVVIGSSEPVYMNIISIDPSCRRNTFDVAAPEGTFAWNPWLKRFGADTLNKRYRDRYNASMSSGAWCGWFAVKSAWEAALRSKAMDSEALIAYLERATSRFDGHKGAPLYFDESHRLVQPLYDGAGEELSQPSTVIRCERLR